MPIPTLIAHVRDEIAAKGACVLYGDRLALIFSDDGATEESRLAAIQRFAGENGWHVETRDEATVALFLGSPDQKHAHADAPPAPDSLAAQKLKYTRSPGTFLRIHE